MQKVRIFRARGWRVLFLLLTVLLAGVIFYMSSEPAIESGERSTTIAAEILPLVHPAFETLPPEEQKAVLSSADHILRNRTFLRLRRARCPAFAVQSLLCGKAARASAARPACRRGLCGKRRDSPGVCPGARSRCHRCAARQCRCALRDSDCVPDRAGGMPTQKTTSAIKKATMTRRFFLFFICSTHQCAIWRTSDG